LLVFCTPILTSSVSFIVYSLILPSLYFFRLFLFTSSHFLFHFCFPFLYYEQVIRFVPRFIIINKLDAGVKMMQPSGFGRESSTLHLPSQRLCAYHLPDVYSDRKVSVQPYGSWAKSIPFHVDEVGAMTLAVKREHHLATLPHVVTRSAPEYSVSFPPREIGLYLETDFFDKRYVRMNVHTYFYQLQLL
jgi:SHR-binding domain of vacuolar-sorting associated protein 13